MKVTLTHTAMPEQEPYTGQVRMQCATTLTLEGTPTEIQAGINELFDADRANDLRQDLGLNATSATRSSGPQ